MALSIPKLEPDVDTLTAAIAYAESGIYVGPAKAGTKHPGSLLGDDWPSKTSRDIQVITDFFAGRPKLGLFLHMGRSGGFAVDVDHPELVPEVLRHEIACSGAPFQSTRPDQEGRGHAVFAFPEGRVLGNGTGQLGTGWGQIRGLNGVIMAEPTDHPDEGGCYRWLRHGPVPIIGEAVASLLPDGSPAEDAVTDEVLHEFLMRHKDSNRPNLLTAVLNTYRAEVKANESRHESAVRAMTWAMREAQAGLYPALEAANAVRALFVTDMGRQRRPDDRVLPESKARDEFTGIAAWSVGQALSDDPVERRRQIGGRAPDSTEIRLQDNGFDATPTQGACLPEGFWLEREEFGVIAQEARFRTVAPTAMLQTVLATLSAHLPFGAKLPPMAGDPLGLQMFVVPVGRSGGGKTQVIQGAQHVLPLEECRRLRDIPHVGVSTGEGLIEQFIEWVDEDYTDADGKAKKRKVRKQVRHNLFVTVDEGGLMAKLSARQGSTIWEVLRQAWIGVQLDTPNATAERRRHVPAGSYAIGVVMGLQPELAAHLLRSEATGGSPQRFLWAHVRDPQAQRGSPAPQPLKWRAPDNALLSVEASVQEAFEQHRFETMTGEDVDPLAVHEPVMRIRVAALLAILAGRTHVNDDDWRLAGVVVETSAKVRNEVDRTLTAIDRATTEAGHRKAAERAARVDEKVADRKLASAAKSVANKVRKHADEHEHDGDGGCPRSCLTTALRSDLRRDVGVVPAAEEAERLGWVRPVDERWHPGESRPA